MKRRPPRVPRQASSRHRQSRRANSRRRPGPRAALGGALALVISAAPVSSADEPPAAGQGRRSPGGLSCTPGPREVQTRRPIPVACQGGDEVVRMSLRYQEHRQAAWKTLEMERVGASFRGQIPCEATMDSGRIRYFVIAIDALGDPADTLGSKGAPLRFTVNPQSVGAPAAYPGEAPPARCEERVLCPPDFPGCQDAPRAAKAQAPMAPPRPKRDWLGVHFAADVGFISGSDVCAEANSEFECFAGASPYPAPLPADVAVQPGELGDAYPGTGIGSGAATGTVRVLLSYDHAFAERLSAGVRLGYAFGASPAANGAPSFLPLHAEARVQYWLTDLSATGLRPYIHLGGGVAQVEVSKSALTVRDCSEEAGRQAFLDCSAARDAYAPANQPELPSKTLDAYRTLGDAFLTGGGGVLLSLGSEVALQVNLNAMLMTPTVGFVVQPSIGLLYGL